MPHEQIEREKEVSADIFGQRVAAKRDPMWHSLGTVFNDSPTPEEAVRRTGLDYEIVLAPVGIHAFGRDLPTEKRVAICRQPLPDDNEVRVFGYASAEYGLMQNIELARLLNPLADEWPVETVGALGRGETIFITLAAGSSDIAGEQIDDFFMLTDSHTGGASCRIAYTPVRVVCKNTLIMGISAASMSLSISHTNNTFAADTKFYVELMVEVRRVRERMREAMRRLADTQIVREDAEAVVAAAFPYPSRPKKAQILDTINESKIADALDPAKVQALEYVSNVHAYQMMRVDTFRAGTLELYDKICDEFPDIAGTSWAVYNAVVECSDYRNGASNESIAESALFGPRAAEKTRAWKAAAALAGVGV